jgi:alkylation response protein AidB-like acyl-CoA dehydrogenase
MKRFIISEEQTILGDTAHRFLQQRYAFEHREKVRSSPEGLDAAVWSDFAAMGWLGLPFPAHLGGSDGTMVDVALLMEHFGAALVAEPYIPTVVAGGTALLACGDAHPRDEMISCIGEGRLNMALAVAEPGGGYDHFSPTTSAVREAAGYRLNGEKAVVIGAPQADMLVVSAQASGAPQGAISLFLVPRGVAGVTLRSYATIDGRRAADVILRDVCLAPDAVLGEHGQGRRILERVIDASTVAFLGEASGVVQAAVDLTAQYLNVREQFGRKLSSFQALRHRVAAMYIIKEEVRALCRQAALAVADDPGSADAREAISAAKIHAGLRGRRVCEEAIQLHGAIAITDEYIAGHFLKRMVAIDHMFGNAHHHLDLFTTTARSYAWPSEIGLEAAD